MKKEFSWLNDKVIKNIAATSIDESFYDSLDYFKYTTNDTAKQELKEKYMENQKNDNNYAVFMSSNANEA